MNETDNFALVPRPPTTLEKTAPGAKRILSEIMADALALTKKASQFRIVHVDDEDWLLAMIGDAIRAKFQNLVIDTFQNGDKAWEELQRAEPDLLIIDLFNDNVPGRKQDLGMSGFKLLRLLQQRNVKYPILVLSGMLEGNHKDRLLAQKEWPDLNVSLMQKGLSCTLANFYDELDKHIEL